MMGMGASEHLNAVVQQLLPPPLRYRLVWHTEEGKTPLYVWKAVPPGPNFVAMGMAITMNERTDDAANAAPMETRPRLEMRRNVLAAPSLSFPSPPPPLFLRLRPTKR